MTGIGAHLATLEIEHAAACEDDREPVDPVARRPVLERRGAGGVRRDDAADEGAGEGWKGAYQRPPGVSRFLQCLEGDARAGAEMHVARFVKSEEAPGREHEAASGRRAACDGRLRADGQHVRRQPKEFRDLGLRSRPGDAVGAAVRKVRSVLEVAPIVSGDRSMSAFDRSPTGSRAPTDVHRPFRAKETLHAGRQSIVALFSAHRGAHRRPAGCAKTVGDTEGRPGRAADLAGAVQQAPRDGRRTRCGCSSCAWSFGAGHIPGAINVPLGGSSATPSVDPQGRAPRDRDLLRATRAHRRGGGALQLQRGAGQVGAFPAASQWMMASAQRPADHIERRRFGRPEISETRPRSRR